MATFDCLIIGGGVVGLSLAYELSSTPWRIGVVDRQQLGQEASWAGAGILPPANRATATHPYDALRGLSFELHPQWAERLRAETGIDTGFRRCGGVYVGRTPGEKAALQGLLTLYRDERVRMETLDEKTLSEIEPGLAEAFTAHRIRVAYYLPDEAQLRNPWHLRALAAACRQRGVTFFTNAEFRDWHVGEGRLAALATSTGQYAAERFCVTAGAWTQFLLAKLGVASGILPIRGQMALLHADRTICRRVINDGPRYLVPREDGHVLVGSTEEEVGFDRQTTDEAIAELVRFAQELVPDLRNARLVRGWAGLRPGSYDGLPYLGPIPGLSNAFVAAGHFRSGLYLSPGTATTMSQLIRGERPAIDLSPFHLNRN